MSSDPPPADTPVSSHVEMRQLRPAELEDVKQSLAFALRYNGRKRIDTAGEFMAKITAERLVEHLERSNFVVMQKPPAPHGTDQHHARPIRRVKEEEP